MFWPINKVGFSFTQWDNKREVMDFANAITSESLVKGFLAQEGSGVIGNIPAGSRGPMSYATVPYDMNPPNLTMWSVMRGYPRKRVLHATAALTVGVFSDQISIADPFI